MRIEEQATLWQCFKEELPMGSRVLVTPHVRADADAICSSLALALALNKLGYVAEVYLDEQPSSYYDFLPAMDQLKVYDALHERKDFDALFVLDCHESSRLEKRAAWWNVAPVLFITDHHQLAEEESLLANSYYWVAADWSSTSAMIYRLIREMEAVSQKTLMDAELAFLLASGIYADTGGLRYSNASPATFRIVADLAEYDISLTHISEKLFSTISLEEFRARGLAFTKTRVECDGRLAWCFFQERELEACAVSRDQLGAFSSLLREVKGVDLSLFILELVREDGRRELNISIRSSENFTALPIAKALGGGGHLKACGATVPVEKNIYDSVEKVLRVARQGLAGELEA